MVTQPYVASADSSFVLSYPRRMSHPKSGRVGAARAGITKSLGSRTSYQSESGLWPLNSVWDWKSASWRHFILEPKPLWLKKRLLFPKTSGFQHWCLPSALWSCCRGKCCWQGPRRCSVPVAWELSVLARKLLWFCWWAQHFEEKDLPLASCALSNCCVFKRKLLHYNSNFYFLR